MGENLMGIDEILQQYFIDPIAERSGYNVVNTLVYAVIAIAAAYLIYRWLRPKFTKRLVLHIIPFILFGSTVRVLTDSIDSGVAQQHVDDLFGLVGLAVNSGIYNYGTLTVTPGIYVVTGLITLASIFVSDRLKRPMLLPAIGLILWLPHLVLLTPMFKHWDYAAGIIAIVAVSIGLSIVLMQRLRIDGDLGRAAVAAHSLDGTASFMAIEVFNRLADECTILGRCYGGQHVVERTIGETLPYGTLFYLLLKLVFVLFAVKVIEQESKDEKEKNFIYTLIIIFGLAPGLRNLLRILVGA
jgi:uncharacterized membrane protein